MCTFPPPMTSADSKARLPVRPRPLKDVDHIRKSNWNTIFGTFQSALNDDEFNRIAGDFAAPTRAAGRGIVGKATTEIGRDSRAEDVEELVRNGAENLRASLRGCAGEAPNTLAFAAGSVRQRSRRPASLVRSNVPLGLRSSESSVESAMSRAPSRGSRCSRPVQRSDLQAQRPVDAAQEHFAPSPRSHSSTRVKPHCCDKCDGPHATESCPHFRKPREKHKDAWENLGSKSRMTDPSAEQVVLRNGRCVRQPGDGNCLFHSLCYGLRGKGGDRNLSAMELRGQLARFIASNPQLTISGDTLEEWVRWDSNSSVSDYARRMSATSWGGALEMAACARLKKVNVHVYERDVRGFRRISCFSAPQPTTDTVHVLYQGGVHYDALVPS
eukprot:TRINITY_DN54038_c0_g1_i1.p1 TRINITY_DN54038_c0_g1~~TRINITY_DN54038_c0_g1_i1.p1  ORF type:complete len:385 (+),score=32.02 TRINITY_DN54038_c0_g1_i1:91-1245(+)